MHNDIYIFMYNTSGLFCRLSMQSTRNYCESYTVIFIIYICLNLSRNSKCAIRNISIQQAQNICITFVQRRPNVFDVGSTLYKSYTNVLCLLGTYLEIAEIPRVILYEYFPKKSLFSKGNNACICSRYPALKQIICCHLWPIQSYKADGVRAFKSC